MMIPPTYIGTKFERTLQAFDPRGKRYVIRVCREQLRSWVDGRSETVLGTQVYELTDGRRLLHQSGTYRSEDGLLTLVADTDTDTDTDTEG